MAQHDLIALVACDSLKDPGPETLVLGAHGFAAVLSAAPRPVITLPVSRREALAKAAERQALLEKLMACGPVLPVAPRTLIEPASVPATLAANAPMLHDLSGWLRGAAQFQITVGWQPGEAMRHFRDAPELAPLFEAGHVQADDLDRAMTGLMARLRGEMRRLLDPVVRDVIALPVSAEVLLNLCVLLPARDERSLDKAVAAIDAIWSAGLSIRQIGPSPATAFALLHLSQVADDQVVQARRTLGISAGQPLDVPDARRAALMAREADVSAIRHAADILEAHARAGAESFHLIKVQAQDQGEAHASRAEVA